MKRLYIYIVLQICILCAARGQEGQMYVSNRDTVAIEQAIKQAAAYEYTMPDTCISLLQPLLQASRNAGFAHGIANALIHQGIAYMAEGEADKSLSSYLAALPYVPRVAYDKELIARLYSGIGTPYLKKRDYQQASAYYYKALKEINDNKLQNTEVACRLYLNMCSMWWSMRRFDYALDYILQSEKNALKRNDTVSLIAIYGNLSTLYFSRHESAKSYDYAQRALKLAEQKKVIRAQQLILTNIGTSLREEDKAKEAIPYFEKAISLADDQRAYQHNLHAYYNLACAYYATGDYPRALQYANHYMQQSEQLDMDKEHAGDIMQVYADIYQKKKDYKQANVWLNKYLDFLTTNITKQADSSISRLERDYRVSQKDKELAQKQLELSRQKLELKNKNIWIGSVAAGLVLSGMLLFIVLRISRHRQYTQAMQIRNLKQERELGYLKAMIDGEEKERARLARELHDGIGGMLASARMSLGALSPDEGDAAKMKKLDEVMRLLNDTASEVRQTAHNLMPDALIKNSLKEALLLYCADINTGGILEIDIQFHGQLEAMDKAVELIFYRITQELIQNIVKHSKATEAVIQIVQDNGRLNLIVEDNGIGFDQDEITKGFGLQNLQFRVQALQGYISINPVKGVGTSVYIEFDLEKLKHA